MKSDYEEVTRRNRIDIFGLLLVVLLALLGAASLAWILFSPSRAEREYASTIYVIDASTRMLLPFGSGDSSRLDAARNLVNELVRGAPATTVTGVRLFGSGADPQPCDDTTLLVEPAANNQQEIAQGLAGIHTGSAESALTLAIASAVRDLRLLDHNGPRLLVLVTGGEDTCLGERSLFLAEEMARANAELETVVIDLDASPRSAEALKVLVADLGGGTYVEADNTIDLSQITDALQDYFSDFEDGEVADVGETVIPTPSPTNTATPSPLARTATATSSPTPTPEPEEETRTATASAAGAPTSRATVRATATTTPATATRAATRTPTATRTPSRTPTATRTPTRTPTATATPTNTPTPTPTNTPTPTPTNTPTPTMPPTATASFTPEPPPPPTDTPTPEPPPPPTDTPTATATPTPVNLTVDGNCPDADFDDRCDDGPEFEKIQAAIGAADTGSTITVITTGVHTEADINVNKGVVIVGNAPGGVVIQAAPARASAGVPVFRIAAGNTVTLQALIVQHGQPGIHNDGTLTLNRTTIRNNDNGPLVAAGGIHNNGTLTIINSTISGNIGASGGGIFASSGQVLINNSTIVANGAQAGSGIQNSSGAVTIANSIVANNTGSGNCNGAIVSAGYNLSSDASCAFTGPGDQQNIDPQLSSLQSNGTHTPLAGSPAIDAGNPGSDGIACRSGDQLGEVRPLDGNGDGTPICDIGSVEVPPPAPAQPQTRFQSLIPTLQSLISNLQSLLSTLARTGLPDHQVVKFDD